MTGTVGMERCGGWRLAATAATAAIAMTWLWLGVGCAATGPTVRPQDDQDDLLRFVPPAAQAVLVVRERAVEPVLSLLRHPPALQQEVSPYLRAQLGVDLSRAKGAVVYVTSLDPTAAAVFVHLERPSLVGQPLDHHGGVPLVAWAGDDAVVAAQLADGVLIGNRAGVALGIDASLAHAKGDAPTGRLFSHLAAVSADNVDVILSANRVLLPPSAQEELADYGVTTATFSYGAGQALTARFDTRDAAGAERLRQLIDRSLGLAVSNLAEAKDAAKADEPVPAALLQMYGYHQLRHAHEHMVRTVEGNRLSLRYPLPQGGAWAHWGPLAVPVGALAAMAGVGGLPRLLGVDSGPPLELLEPTEEPSEERGAAGEGEGEPRPDEVVRFRLPVLPSHPQMGPRDAPVTIVQFTDLECPYCRRARPTIEALFKAYPGQLRWVVRHNPLPFHRQAMPAAELAMEAFTQKGNVAFFAVHDRMLENQKALSEEDLAGYAAQAGLDVDRYRKAVASKRHRAAIDRDREAAARLGATGTPSFFINGRLITGAQPFDAFKTVIDGELATAAQLRASGVPATEVYARLTADGLTRAPKREPKGRPQSDTVYAVPVPRDRASRGAQDAPVVVQIFSDFECSFCGRVVPTLEAVGRRYPDRVRFVFRNYPLPFHQHAELAAEAAHEVFVQRGSAAFFRYHDLLFAGAEADALAREDLERYAKQVGKIDLGAFRDALDTHKHLPVIEADKQAIKDAGLRIGTPSFLINGRVVQGAQPLETFVQAIERALRETHALPPGTRPGQPDYAAAHHPGPDHP